MGPAFSTIVDRFGGLIVIAWAAVTLALHAVAPKLSTISRDDDVRFFPPEYRSVIGQDLLEAGFPGDAASSGVVFIADRPHGKLTREDFDFVLAFSRDLTALGEKNPEWGVKTILNFRSPVIGPRLIGAGEEGGQGTLISIALRSTYLSKQARLTVNELQEVLIQRRADAPKGLRLSMTGSAVVGHDINEASLRSIHNTTYMTIMLVVGILLLVYRSPLLALITLVTIALSVDVSLKAIAALTMIPGLNFQVINITEIFVVVVLFGAGTDYCLFLISRYREELGRGQNSRGAIATSLSRLGGALLASAGTVMCGLSLLTFSSFAKIQNTGPAIALSLAISLLASLTLAPILLRWARGAAFWPFKPPKPRNIGPDGDWEDVPGIWAWIADLVIRHPYAILGISIMPLIPLAVIGMGTRPSYNQLADLHPEEPSVQGAKAIRRYFAVGELGPTALLVQHPTLKFRSPEGRAVVAALSDELAALPDVHEVRSLARPLGKPQDGPKPVGSLQELLQRGTGTVVNAVAENRYVSAQAAREENLDHIIRLEMILKTDPFSAESLATLESIRKVVEHAVGPQGVLAGASRWGFSGATASVEDLKTVIQHDERRMYWLVTSGVYLILVVLIRKPLICLYLIATVVLGYLAALGATELVFKHYVWTGPEPWSGLDWKVGFFLFVILIAVGEDYNIFLMSRVMEERRERGPIEGMRHAVAVTGGIISSCGLIMAGTFGSMLTGQLMALKELGFALALGVLVDTFVVRPVMVPAFLVILERFRPEAAPAAGADQATAPSEFGAEAAEVAR